MILFLNLLYALFFKSIFFPTIFVFLTKGDPKTKIMVNTAKNSFVPELLSYFIIKTLLFDVDFFSQTFDMESPKYRENWEQERHLCQW